MATGPSTGTAARNPEMTERTTYRAVGLMSGTSMDGIDAALIESDGEDEVRRLGFISVPYDEAFRQRLRAALGRDENQEALANDLTERHAGAVATLLESIGHPAEHVDVIGFHGQTVLHRPDIRRTLQIGAPDLLARRCGCPVVFALRVADVAAGGEGAPLVPVYHRALTRSMGSTAAVLNLGGVGNVTWIDCEAGPEAMLAFDTGPANALLDDFMHVRCGLDCDAGGALAATGKADPERLESLLGDPFFDRAPPKSLDRDHFARRAETVLAELSDADGAALLTAFSAAAAASSGRWFPRPAQTWIACGGGRHNRTLMTELEKRLDARLISADDLGWDGDAVEAEAFAYLAIRSLRKLPLTFPGTTGVPKALTGGSLHLPG